jgi:20S proteasome alpha/beta subunit
VTTHVQLADIAHARSGDKGDTANVALFAASQTHYQQFVQKVTVQRVRELFGDFVQGDIERYEMPRLLALNFVLHQALDGGAAHSLRSDPLGKSFGSLLLRMFVELDTE